MQIFGEIPFVKPQNDTETTDKRSETIKKMIEKGSSCLGLVFTACLVHGTLLASSKMFQKHTFSVGDIHLGLSPSRGIRLEPSVSVFRVGNTFKSSQ